MIAFLAFNCREGLVGKASALSGSKGGGWDAGALCYEYSKKVVGSWDGPEPLRP